MALGGSINRGQYIPYGYSPQAAQQLAEQKKREKMQEQQYNFSLGLQTVGQQNQNRDRGAYNTIAEQNATLDMTRLGYQMEQDRLNRQIQGAALDANIAGQAQANMRYTRGLRADAAQTEVSNVRYQQSLDETIAQILANRARRQVESATDNYHRMYGYGSR